MHVRKNKMALDGILEEAIHSFECGTLTNEELRGIMIIVERAKADIIKNDGRKRSVESHAVKVAVNFDDEKVSKLEGDIA